MIPSYTKNFLDKSILNFNELNAILQNFDERKKNYLENKTTKLTNKQIQYINNKVPQEIIDFYEKETT